MYSKQQLKDFLSQISQNAEFPVFNYISAEKYAILIKCRVEPGRDAPFYSLYISEWIKKFTKFTKNGWIVRQCFPNLKRLIYRKVFVCQYSQFNKTKNPEQAGPRNKQCKAKIDFKIKFINRNTIKNDEMLKNGLNLTISINFTHSHGILTRESLNLLRCSADTDEIFYKYFTEGHTVVTAKSYHELTLLSNYAPGSNPLKNREINPTLHHATYLFKKKQKEGSYLSFPDMMAEKAKVLEESGGILKHSEGYSIVVVITPFMKNVLSSHDLDNIIVDSTVLKECVVSFFLVPSPLGALPIACAIHSQTTEHSFNQAFLSTKTLLESQIANRFEPNKIMMNDIKENYALEEIFPNACLSLTHVSLVEKIWRTICEGEIKIEAKHRHDLMELINSLLYENNLEEAELVYKKLESDNHVESNPKLKEYLVDIWKTREDITPNKVIDISLSTLKQFLLVRCCSYNNLIMIDVLQNILDNHWCQILHAHLSNKSITETYTKFVPKDKEVMKTLNGQKDIDKYTIENKRKKKVTFRTDSMCCDCIKGRRPNICEHLCAALHSVNLTTILTEDQRVLYTSLAGEREIKPELPTEYNDELENDIDEPIFNDNEPINDHFFVVKQEIAEVGDPLDTENDDNCESNTEKDIDNDMKTRYVTGLRALNDEFRRLNRLFMENPSASNLDTIRQLARELSKIRPVERVQLSNVFVDVNDNGHMEEN